MARHPNREQLASWLDGSSTHLDHHIEGCAQCASELDQLGEPQSAAEIGSALLTLLKPPDDLHQRVSERIARRLQDRNDADLFRSLLGIPFEAGKLLFEADDSGSHARTDSDEQRDN